MYFVRVRAASPDSGLDQLDLLLLQGRIAGLATIAAIGQQGVHAGAFFQVGQGICQQLTIIHIVGCNLHLGDQLQFVFRITGFGQVGNVPLVMGVAFGAVGGFQIVHRLQTA